MVQEGEMQIDPEMGTIRQEMTDAEKALADLAEVVLSIDCDPVQNTLRVLQYALDAVQGQFVLLNKFDFERCRIVTRQGCFLPAGFRRAGKLSGRICYEELIRGDRELAFFPDLNHTRYMISDPDVRQYRLRSYIGTPIRLAGRSVGSLAVFGDQPHEFDQNACNVLRISAQLIAFIEERRQFEQQLQRKRANDKLLSAISTKAMATRDPAFLDFCLENIGRLLAPDTACLFWFDHQSNEFTAHHSHWTPRGLASGSQYAEAEMFAIPLIKSVIEAQRPFACNDTAALTDKAARKFYRRKQVGAFLLMPIWDGQKVLGLLAMHMCSGSRQWEEESLDTLAAIMGIIAQWKQGSAIYYQLDESQALNSQMIQLSPSAIYQIDFLDRRFTRVNDYMCKTTGYSEEELLAMNPEELLAPSSRYKMFKRMADMSSGRSVSDSIDLKIKTRSGSIEWGRFHIRHLYENRRIWGANVVAHLITKQKKIQRELARHHRKLESLVKDRTFELSLANQKLREEVARRTQTAKELRMKSERLKELNTAMSVLLDKRNEDRLRFEENIRVNLVQLIEPYLDRLDNSGLNASQQQLLDVIRMNLNEVMGSPMPELSAKYYIFSPAELQVANLIRKGRTSKEMAQILNISSRTVESYRNSIRKKLGLKKKKVNLKTYLSSKE